jgi:hypothetical protein
MIRRSVRVGVRRGERCGREDRSTIPAAPNRRYRPAHRAAVVGETWNRSAARRTGQPPSTTQRASSKRPRGASLALASDTKTSGDVRSSTARTPLGGLPLVSQPRRHQRPWSVQLALVAMAALGPVAVTEIESHFRSEYGRAVATTTARNRAIDHLPREASRENRPCRSCPAACQPSATRAGGTGDRRPVAADLHLLPPGAGP